MKVLTIRSMGRYGSFIKIFALVVFVTFSINFYISTNNIRLLQKFKQENLTIQDLQLKISNLMQRGQVSSTNELDDGITEQARRVIEELKLTSPGTVTLHVVDPTFFMFF
jgi:hypothetical protein